MSLMRDYEFYYTQDGSIGLYSYTDEDVYHSKFGALSEAWEKFILPADINKKLNNQPDIRVLDICYGIGYNTKALMSFVINSDEKFLRKNNFLKKILNKIIKFLKKIFLCASNIASIGINKIFKTHIELSLPIEKIDVNNLISKIHIDCLEINEELVKISPLLKTINYRMKNKKEIAELLDLKFNKDYDRLNKKFRLHKYVNFILINALINHYKEDYFTEDFKKVISAKSKRRFLDKSMLEYTRYKQNSWYNLLPIATLTAFLHNIYYAYLSKRDKNIDFKRISELFELNFYIKDARKTILEIKGEYDYVFMDAFTFSKAPELWSVEFIKEIYNHLSDSGVIMTYSNSAIVRNTFLENNFYVGKILDKKTGKYIGTIASKNKFLIKYPLSPFEIGLCNTKAGIPYHDLGLSHDKKYILKQRETEFNRSNLISSSAYIKKYKARSTNNEE